MELNQDESAGPAVQSVERAFALLSIVARGSAHGTRLNEIVERSGLTKTTVHRLLQQLIASGMLLQGSQRVYQLGPGTFELGVAAARSFPLRDLASPLLEELAEETGDTVFLMVRIGNDALCIDRKMGSYPIKVFSIDVGHRQPMGVGAGGLAMLCALAPMERAAALEDIGRRLAVRPIGALDMDMLQQLVSEASQRGWAQSGDQAVRGVAGVGVALKNSKGKPFAAISVGSVSMRMTPERFPQVALMVKKKAAQFEQLIAGRARR